MKILPDYIISFYPAIEEALEELRLSVFDHAYEMLKLLDIDELTAAEIRNKLLLYSLKFTNMKEEWSPNGKFYRLYAAIKYNRTRQNALKSIGQSGGQFEALWTDSFTNKDSYNYKTIQIARHYEVGSDKDGYFYISGNANRSSDNKIQSSAIKALTSDIIMNQGLPAGYTYLYIPFPRPLFPADAGYFFNVHMLDYDRLHYSNDCETPKVADGDDKYPASMRHNWKTGVGTPWRAPYWFDYHYNDYTAYYNTVHPIKNNSFDYSTPERGTYYYYDEDDNKVEVAYGDVNFEKASSYVLSDTCSYLNDSNLSFPTYCFLHERWKTTYPNRLQKFNMSYVDNIFSLKVGGYANEDIAKLYLRAWLYCDDDTIDALINSSIAYNGDIEIYSAYFNHLSKVIKLTQYNKNYADDIKQAIGWSSPSPLSSDEVSLLFKNSVLGFVDTSKLEESTATVENSLYEVYIDYYEQDNRSALIYKLRDIYNVSLQKAVSFLTDLTKSLPIVRFDYSVDKLMKELSSLCTMRKGNLKCSISLEPLSTAVGVILNNENTIDINEFIYSEYGDYVFSSDPKSYRWNALYPDISKYRFNLNHFKQFKSFWCENTVFTDMNDQRYAATLSDDIESQPKRNSMYNWLGLKQSESRISLPLNYTLESTDDDSYKSCIISDNEPPVSEETFTPYDRPTASRLDPVYIGYLNPDDPTTSTDYEQDENKTIFPSDDKTDYFIYSLGSSEDNTIQYNPALSYNIISIGYKDRYGNQLNTDQYDHAGFSYKTYLKGDPASKKLCLINKDTEALVCNYIMYKTSVTHKMWFSPDHSNKKLVGVGSLYNKVSTDEIYTFSSNSVGLTYNILGIYTADGSKVEFARGSVTCTLSGNKYNLSWTEFTDANKVILDAAYVLFTVSVNPVGSVPREASFRIESPYLYINHSNNVYGREIYRVTQVATHDPDA